MSELTTDQALGFIADGLCVCEGTLEEHHTNGCPQDNEAASWLAQVQREAKIEALREAARELQKDMDRPLGANAHPREVGRRDRLQKSWSLLHALADRMEDDKMSTRDELEAALISGFAIKNAVWVENDMPCLRLGEVADYLLSQGWRPPMRMIETVEELEALPDRAIIFDKNGDVYERRKNEWENIYISPIYADEDSPAEIHPRGPFRVVWEPEQ